MVVYQYSWEENSSQVTETLDVNLKFDDCEDQAT